MTHQFTVKQEKGKDSTVHVHECKPDEWSNDNGWNAPKDFLRFETDQSMISNSVRAGEVEHAIEVYARQRGYRLQKPFGKYEIIAIYDSDFHSSVAMATLREQVKTHPNYQASLETIKADKNAILRLYGRQIDQLKQLISHLEKKEEDELSSLRQSMIDCQNSIINELDIPDVINKRDIKWLTEKSIEKIDHNYYRRYYDGLPARTENIIDLLD